MGLAAGRIRLQSGLSLVGRRNWSVFTVISKLPFEGRDEGGLDPSSSSFGVWPFLNFQPFAWSCHTCAFEPPRGLYSPRATSVCEAPSGATSHSRPSTCALSPLTSRRATMVGAPRRVKPRLGAAGSLYVAVPSWSAAGAVAHALPPPATGSIAAPTCGSPPSDSIVRGFFFEA